MRPLIRKLQMFIKKDMILAGKDIAGHMAGLTFLFMSVWTYYFISKQIDNDKSFFTFVYIGAGFIFYIYSIYNNFQKEIRIYRSSGILEVAASSPTGMLTFITGLNLWNVCLSTLEFIVFLAAGRYFLQVNIQALNLRSTLPVLGLSAVIMLSLGLISAAISFMFFRKRDPVSFLINGAIFLLCGAYFPISFLPGILQKIAYIIPMTYSLHGLREALISAYPADLPVNPVITLMIFAVVLGPISLAIFRYAIYRLKLDGNLTQA